jgi:hypothetical protein
MKAADTQFAVIPKLPKGDNIFWDTREIKTAQNTLSFSPAR